MSQIARLVAFYKVTLLMLCVAALTALAGHVEIALVTGAAAFFVPHLDALNERIARWHSSMGRVDQDNSGRGVVFDFRIRSRSWRTVAAIVITAGLAGLSLYAVFHQSQYMGLWILAGLLTVVFVYVACFGIIAMRRDDALQMRIDSRSVTCRTPGPPRREWTIDLADIRRVIIWRGEGDRLVFELNDGRKLRAFPNSFGPSAEPAVEALRSVAPQIHVTRRADTWPAIVCSLLGRELDVD